MSTATLKQAPSMSMLKPDLIKMAEKKKIKIPSGATKEVIIAKLNEVRVDAKTSIHKIPGEY